MKLRDFFKTALLLPFFGLAKAATPPMVEVIPKTLDELIGLVIEHRYEGGIERCFIHSRIEDGWFYWRGEEICNVRMNKFWGYRCDDPDRKKELLVINPSDLKAPQYFRFYKP